MALQDHEGGGIGPGGKPAEGVDEALKGGNDIEQLSEAFGRLLYKLRPVSPEGDLCALGLDAPSMTGDSGQR
jgi:hypothetical protein